ncbi:amino acid ABC transporter substrate-binding protein [Spirochaetia bacterium]|nr:amino acid ABC transporter substrate-binding protein [Spirochaetia bacterium]
MKRLFTMAVILLTAAAVFAGGSRQTTDSSVKRVTIGLESGSKPLSYIDENGNKAGYEFDVLNAVDELIPEYSFNLEFVEDDATQIGLETGKYALIGGGLFRTPEREAKYLLPRNISGASVIYIYVHENNTTIQSLDDLVGKNLAPSSPNGGIYNLLTAYNNAHPSAQITITTADGVSLADRFTSVSNGQYDAIVLPNNLGFEGIKQELGLKVKAVARPVQVNGTFFALARDQSDLAAKVDAALATLRANGTLSQLSIKWYGSDTIALYTE